MTAKSTKKKAGDTGSKYDPTRGDTVPAQLEALAVGESFSRGTRIPFDDFTTAASQEWFTKTSRVLSMQVARTVERNPKREFTIERVSGAANTVPYLLCALIVTRTA